MKAAPLLRLHHYALVAGLALVLSFAGCREAPPGFAPGIVPPVEKLDTCMCSDKIDSITFVSTPVKELPAPKFSDTLKGYPFGTKIFLLADSLPKDTKFEISTSMGEKWTEANCLIVTDSVEAWGRLKCKNIISPVVKIKVHPYYERVVVVGNSITSHGPSAEMGWYGDWGMAASAKDKDYLSQVSQKLKMLNPNVQIRVNFDVGFETNYNSYDFEKLNDLANFAPDLVIMRIGENTNMKYLNDYQGKYDQYILKLISKSNAKVICSTTFWRSTIEATYRIRNIAQLRGYHVAELEPLSQDSIYTAKGLFSNSAVAGHPGDKGMKAIADIIIKEL
ncbi:SGNH/GDSL hydrolase family protein [Dyadobacter tibetensis]|uniref:SGNH/GDSL hydrolase family protein n=1 Tax=Dyadobacter tibetensis TaxID=1211851 RepID=UPI00046EB19C|nr:SGNH/GDSL hydrolase family protein [Dyadobacter tibetensis]